MDVYIITGFLGAGKTTTIQKVLPLFKDKKIGLIVNEFGKIGVDGKAFEDYEVAMKEIDNGSIFCSCKIDKFEAVLEEMMQQPLDCIVIETSGLSDPTIAREMMMQSKFSQIQYRGCVTIVDAYHFERVINTAQVSRKQVRIADLVIINKIDLISMDTLTRVTTKIKQLNPYVTIHTTQKGIIKKSWLDTLTLTTEKGQEIVGGVDLGKQKIMLTISKECTLKQFKQILTFFMDQTYRIKGYLQLKDGAYLVNCVCDQVIIEPIAACEYNNKVVVLGPVSDELRVQIEKAREIYCEQLLEMTK